MNEFRAVATQLQHNFTFFMIDDVNHKCVPSSAHILRTHH